MLKKMRSDFKKYSWTLWIVIITFIVGFHLTDAFSGRSMGESDLVSIGGDKIKGQEYYDYMLRTLENYKRQFKDNFNKSLINQLRIPEQVLQNLINSNITHREASKYKITVSDQELKEKIVSLFQRDGNFIGFRAYKDLLNRQRMKVEEFERDLKKDIIVEKFKELITSGLVIDEETLKDEYKKEKDEIDLDFIMLRPDRYEKKLQISDKVLKEYYEKNKEKFKSPERRSGNVIAFKYDDFKKELKITEQELFDYFKKNQKMFFVAGKTKISRIFLEYVDNKREEVLKKAESLRKQLNSKNFSQKAKEFSQDLKAKEGGDYGYWGWKNFTPQELNFIERLNQDEISPIVDTLKGFSIILVSEKIKDSQEPFDKVKERIKGIIEKKELRLLVAEKLEKIYDKISNEEDIKSKAEKLGVKVLRTALLKNGDKIKDIDEMGYISRNIFSLKQGEISYPVEFMNGIAIVQLLKTEKPVVETFEVAREKVRDKVIESKKVDMIFKQAMNISKKLNGMKDEKKIKDYLEKEKLTSTEFKYKRGDKLSYLPKRAGLDDLVFSLQEGKYSSPIRFEAAVVIMKAKGKNVTGLIEFEHDKADFYDEKLKKMKSDYFASYIMNKRKGIEVRFNQKLFNEIRDKIMSIYQ